MSPRIVLITGANGFIGRNLAAHFAARGWKVRGLVRHPETASLPFPIDLVRGELPHDLDGKAFENVDTVLHCAYTTRHRSLKQAMLDNEEGTKRIIELSHEAKVKRIVFLSSLSAHENAKSYYGRSKFVLEGLCDRNADLIIRAGLVVGPGDAGVFGRMIAPVLKFPVVPLLDGGRQRIQIIYVDDLCVAVYSAIEKNFTGTLVLADPAGILMKDFLRLIARKFGKKRIFVSIPSGLALYPAKLFELLRIPTPISSENILGLRNLQFVDTKADLAKVGIKLLTPEESIGRIARSGG